MHAAAGRALIEPHQLFALFEAPERRGERADIHGLRGHIEEMRQQSSDFAIEYADELRTLRYAKAKQLFRRQAERMFLVYRCDVIEPVEIRNCLQIGLVFDELLGAAVEKTDVRIDALDYLTVELQNEA